MATLTVDCGSFNKTSKSGNTAYGGVVNFSISAGAVITDCSISYSTQGSSGQTADRAFSLNGIRAHSSGSWAQAGALYANLLQPGNNTFRVTLKSQTGTLSSPGECWWSISGITLTITYSDGSGGSTPPPVGGGGPVVISPSIIDAGAGSVTVVCPAEPGIGHIINWSFGTKSGEWSHYWETGGTGNLDIPLSWLSEMPNSTQGTLVIRSRRTTTPAEPYSYASDKTTNIIINVPASVVPSISDFTATLVSNGVPGTIAGYVQNKSKVTLAMTASGGSYSPIASYEISGGGISGSAATGTFGTFNLSGDVVFTAKVTDGRGRTATRQVAIEIMPYTAPAFSSPEAWRSNFDGVKNQKGTYARLKSGASFSSLGEQNAVSIKGRVYIKGGEAPAWEDMTHDTELILGGGALLFTRTYIAQIQVSDLLESRITEFVIPTKKTGISIMAGMLGAAIGKSAETPGIFDVAWPIVAPNFYPVGAIYQSTVSTSPATLFGGTWAAICAGTFLVAAGTDYEAGSTGGSETHTLTTAEMPSYNLDIYFGTTKLYYLQTTAAQGAGMGGLAGSGSAFNAKSGGSGAAHNNMPPYLAVYMWRRTA